MYNKQQRRQKAKRYKTLFGSALGYAAEGLDMLLLSFVLVYILKEFHLSPVEGGNLTLATTIGMLIGSYLFGFIADLFGRIRTMAFTILLFFTSNRTHLFRNRLLAIINSALFSWNGSWW